MMHELKMNRWFISDTHFSHANIIGYTGRPFQSVSEMNEKLIANWNALINPQDTVFFLGDFRLGTTDFLTSLCSRLHGNKICMRGNHDGTPAKMHTIGFTLVLESAFIKIGRHQLELVHIPSQPAPSHFQLHAMFMKNDSTSSLIDNSIFPSKSGITSLFLKRRSLLCWIVQILFYRMSRLSDPFIAF